ncbi:MAG: glycosyltransferase family 39 protein [Lachnospiraceae bacterium]|nr:glycosyltransferase family 39 protein [Lachnospiraceae bacterium]
MKMKFSVLHIVMLVIMTLLTGVSFVCSNMFPPNYYEYTIIEMDSIGIHVIVLGILVLYFGVLRPHCLKNVNWNWLVKILLPCSLVFSLAASCYWAIRCQYVPVWDPEYICRTAQVLAEDGSLSETDITYLSRYPQQMGLVWIFRLLIGIFGAGGECFMTLHLFLAICIPLIILNGYLLTDRLFEDKEADCYFLLLGTGCICLYFYVNFLYSDIPGILFVLSALNCIVDYEKTGKKKSGIFGCLFFILAVAVRKPILIFVIAAAGMWVLYGLCKRDKNEVVVALGAAFIVLVGSQLFINGLCNHYGVNYHKAEPSLAWIAMGTQKSANGAGWFNGYVDNVYYVHEFDSDLIKEDAVRTIKNNLMGFIKEPISGIQFYFEKILIQWNQPCYQALGVSKEYEEIPGGIVEAIYQGGLFQSTRIYFDCYQWVVYLGFTIYLWKNRKGKEIAVCALIPVLAIFGGILFSLLWEAKSRYILPYLVMMLSYAAKGWRELQKV